MAAPTMYRMPGDTTRVHLDSGGVLDVAYTATDWSAPGRGRRTLTILPTSTGHRGTLVRDLIGKKLTADALLNAAVQADADADAMFTSYPAHIYRSAAHYYEGLRDGLLLLAQQLQGSGWRTNPRVSTSSELAVLKRLAKRYKGMVTRPKGVAVYHAVFPSSAAAGHFDQAASVHGFFTEATIRPLSAGGRWIVPVRPGRT